MAQNENYSQVDLRVGTEAQFNAKVDTLPAGTLFGVTDATVSKADLSTDLKNEINGKYTKPSDGIPKSDLASGVQTSLGKADTALQAHQSITTGSVNGTIAANGTDVAVKGLKALAYKDSLTKADVGLGNVNNTSDEAKPISTATQAALDEKVNTTTTVNGKALTANISLGAADVGVNETNFPGLNKTGTVTSVAVKMNGSVKGTVTSSGTIDLGTVITAHQDISGKQDSLSAAQLAAANSGITAAKVEKYDGYEGTINSKYTKPTSGIPETDLAGDVQTSLAKANSALQSHQTVKLESGTNNGTLKLTVNGTATDNIAVTNLGSAAFTATSNYATAAQGAKADSAIQKPSTPTTESAITINSSGTISTKPLTSITGKSEVAVQSTTPTGDEILWINPNGTGGGGSGGGKLYRHVTSSTQGTTKFTFITYSTEQNSYSSDKIKTLLSFIEYPCYTYTTTKGEGIGYISYQIGPGFILGAILKRGSTITPLDETYETLNSTDTVTEL